MFFVIFCIFWQKLIEKVFLTLKTKTNDFDHRTALGAPIRWSKYTTDEGDWWMDGWVALRNPYLSNLSIFVNELQGEKRWCYKVFFLFALLRKASFWPPSMVYNSVINTQPLQITFLHVIFPFPFPSFSVTVRTLSDQVGNYFLVPKNELHTLWRHETLYWQGG